MAAGSPSSPARCDTTATLTCDLLMRPGEECKQGEQTQGIGNLIIDLVGTTVAVPRFFS